MGSWEGLLGVKEAERKRFTRTWLLHHGSTQASNLCFRAALGLQVYAQRYRIRSRLYVKRVDVPQPANPTKGWLGVAPDGWFRRETSSCKKVT